MKHLNYHTAMTNVGLSRQRSLLGQDMFTDDTLVDLQTGYWIAFDAVRRGHGNDDHLDVLFVTLRIAVQAQEDSPLPDEDNAGIHKILLDAAEAFAELSGRSRETKKFICKGYELVAIENALRVADKQYQTLGRYVMGKAILKCWDNHPKTPAKRKRR